jgi:hypothetical protein
MLTALGVSWFWKRFTVGAAVSADDAERSRENVKYDLDPELRVDVRDVELPMPRLEHLLSTSTAAHDLGSLLSSGVAVEPVDPETAKQRLELTSRYFAAIEGQLTEWTRLARRAIWLAWATVIIAACVLAAVIWRLPAFSSPQLWQLAPVIFALAVFVATPMSVLLLERLPRGVDRYSPVPSGGLLDAASAPSSDPDVAKP